MDALQEEQLRLKIASHRLEARADAIVACARNAIRLTVTDDSGLPDDTRLGGTARLPKGVAWPRWRERDQAFIAQIVLSDVAPFDCDRLLPRSGRLLFFYDRESLGMYLPGLSDAETYDYVQLCASLRSDDELVSKLLGHSEPVQGPMEEECQLASNGVYCGDASSDKDPRTAELLRGARDWRLLLQVDSEEAAGMTWGDLGRVYYWIREQDLRAAKFSDCWFILQCT